MNTPTRVGTLALALTVVLSGCTTAGPATHVSVAPRTAAPSSRAPGGGDHSSTQARPTRPLTAAEGTTVVATATALMRLYARPGIDAEAWLDALYPYLTQGAAAAFANTDPSTIPAHTIIGNPAVLSVSTSDGALVDVPTDAGTYQVLLLRKGTSWAADQITAPQGG